MTSPADVEHRLRERAASSHGFREFEDSRLYASEKDAALDIEAADTIAQLVKALEEAETVLALVERPAFPDPLYHEEVKALGRRIGFGALMSTASAGWREVAQERGDPIGGEFVAGPCHGTVTHTLSIIRRARTQQHGAKE
jgi:hypothetical protein